jgi:F-type H+-transporting ATPase subunit delta
MKISKEAQRSARQFFRYCLVDDRLDEDRARKVAQGLAEEKPRHYLQILKYFRKLVEMELAKHHAVIESAVELTDEQRQEIVSGLEARHAGSLTVETKVDPDLIGGVRLRVGDDVYDGSVKGRLQRLEREFS